MLSGDSRGVANAVGAALGVRPGHVHSALLPRDKLDLVMPHYSFFCPVHVCGDICLVPGQG